MKRRWCVPLLLGLLAAAASPVRGQELSRLLAELEAPDDTTRMRAFYELFREHGEEIGPAAANLLAAHETDRNRIARALIRLLEGEHDRLQAELPAATQMQSDFLGDVAWAVAYLRDPRAVPALIAVLPHGSVVLHGLVALGEAALPALLAELRSAAADPQREAAALALGTMAGQAPRLGVRPASSSALRGALMSALADEHGPVRAAAARALIHFDDAAVRRAMHHLARYDPYMKAPAGGQVSYPVREAAQAWLRRHADEERH
jgi:HEAT repeat protein